MRVVAPDLLGFGDSDKPETADLSLVAHAGYVRELPVRSASSGSPPWDTAWAAGWRSDSRWTAAWTRWC